jgi:hypothetical protein
MHQQYKGNALLLLHGNGVNAKAPQYCIIRKSPVILDQTKTIYASYGKRTGGFDFRDMREFGLSHSGVSECSSLLGKR